MHLSNFLNFRPLNNSLELWIIFLELAYPKGCFGKIKKNSKFCECLSILDILRKWLLRMSQSYNSFKKLTRDYIQNQVYYVE